MSLYEINPHTQKSSKRILITGATGFIGGSLLARCLHAGYVVRIALRRQADFPCESFVVGDINGETNWQEALKEVATVVHLAAYAHVTNRARVERDRFRRTNVEGVANLARHATRARVKQFVFLSSIGAMTESSEHQLSPAAPCNPTTHYGRSKLEAEILLKDISTKHAMQWTIIRPPLVYGPGNPGNMKSLFKLVRSGLPLPFASLNNRRSFIYVENLVDVILACVANPNAFGKVFLPSDGEDVSTPDFIRRIAAAEPGDLNCECSDGGCAVGGGRLFPFPKRLLQAIGVLPGFRALRKLTASLYVDSSSLRKELGWRPPFSMSEGLARTLSAGALLNNRRAR